MSANIHHTYRYVSRKARISGVITPYGTRYTTVLVAIAESALVTWVALLVYEIASLAPTGHITVSPILSAMTLSS